MNIGDLASACARVKFHCQRLQLKIIEQKEIQYGRQYKVSFHGETAMFNVYFGKKGLSLVIQGNPNGAKKVVENLFKAIRAEASVEKQDEQKVDSSATLKSKQNERKVEFPATLKCKQAETAVERKAEPKADYPTSSKSKQLTLSDAQFKAEYDEPWIGTDETGKGDFFGPLITAGVIVDPEAVPLLRSLGVDDSKKITDAKIPGMAAEIRKICYGKCNVIQLVPAKYNELYGRMQAQGKTLTHMLAWMHATVLENLLQRQRVNLAVADKFANEGHIIRQLKDLGKTVNLIQVTKGERNVAVAAASILARDALLTWHTNTQRELGMVLPKGATDVINTGRQYVRKFGTEALANVAKLHFKTTQNVLNGLTA